MTESGSPYSEHSSCLNCGVPLRGQYCAHCGQRAQNRLISLWELMRDAFGDLFELDSRLWRTLGPLLRKPGQLTKDYLQGRRARYMPPFRTYLVLSVIFFVVAFFNPQEDLGLLFGSESQPSAADVAVPEDDAATVAEAEALQIAAAKKQLEELAQAGVVPEEVVDNLDGYDAGFNIDFDDGANGGCSISDESWDEVPEWLSKRVSRARMIKACDRIKLDEGKTFLGLLLDKIPVALIVLLPLMAFVLKILYPLSRRYFVEHLLFFVHFHAFFFLILILQKLFYNLASLLSVPKAIPILVIVAASFYIPVYLYLAMRHVYDQGRLATLAKYVVLLTTYVTGASLTLLGAVVFAMLSVSV